FVYDLGEGPGALINPKMVRSSGVQDGPEGCLSLPGIQGEVRRPMRVVVRGLNREGEEVRIEAEGLMARCFCHEMDHLDGILFIDRADPSTLHWVGPTEEDDTEEALAGHVAAA
ncbi:MAG: peptide deformylase, partial [Armatimonadota bacterium]|nr:peptide deformylase [Armatimonadota bacterium]